MGTVTRRFFAEGDEQEATQYEHVDLNGGALDAPKVEFDSFDKVPRKRRPLVAVVGILSLLVMGGVAWKGGRQLHGVRSWVAAAIHAPVAARPIAAHTGSIAAPPAVAAPVAAAPPAPVTAPVAAETQNAKEVARPIARRPESPPANAAPVESPPRQPIEDEKTTAEPTDVPTRPTHAAGEARDESAANHPRPRRSAAGSGDRARPRPLHGYVWSPTAKALVPAQNSLGESQLDVNANPTPEPNASPAETSPPPVDQAPRPTDPAPIVP